MVHSHFGSGPQFFYSSRWICNLKAGSEEVSEEEEKEGQEELEVDGPKPWAQDQKCVPDKTVACIGAGACLGSNVWVWSRDKALVFSKNNRFLPTAVPPFFRERTIRWK